ncbi:MAG: sugar transferase [Bacteroidales bacterium]|nr:sugar transferase [Bacteroidales bacterium]
MKRRLFRLQYETDGTFAEPGSDVGARLEDGEAVDPVAALLLDEIAGMGCKQAVTHLGARQAALGGDVVVMPFTTRTPEAIAWRLDGRDPKLVFLSRPLHTTERLDECLAALNESLPAGACVVCHSMTSVLRRSLIRSNYPWGVRHVLEAWEYVWHRVCPKLRLTHGLYFALTHGKNRSFSRVEIMGRLYRAGFEVIDEQSRGGEFFVTARKAGLPVTVPPPTGSPVIHLRRIGYGGKEIVVHKLRTMYTYSEYLQPYVYRYSKLDHGGKFKDDYRVNFWGRLLRRGWLDELPMVWNLVRGDIKLVGVRPLSRQYFSLYSPEMQRLRTQAKPGLLPPFYYDRVTPDSLDEVQASERRYLEAYLKSPRRTDWRYFWGIVGNIVLRRKRSK